MRIVIIEQWFSEKMGYAENCLPKALAALGHEVHVIASTAQVYFDAPFYRDVYEPYLGPPVLTPGEKSLDGFTLHRLPLERWHGRLRLRGLLGRLHALRPDVVQTFHATTLTTYLAALGRLTCGYKLFTGNHEVKSVFAPARLAGPPSQAARVNWLVRLSLPGRAVGWLTEKCYAVTPDAADIATRFYGVPAAKIQLSPLGVDTALFCPPHDEPTYAAREALRHQLGFVESDIVCIYTGRFTVAKNPGCLAKAVAILSAQGLTFRGLFVGEGPQIEDVASVPGCAVRPFAPYHDLPTYYRAADIGVWPMEESTSMLDAAACGLPIITNGRLQALDHLVGGWLPYQAGDASDLARALLMLRDAPERHRMGQAGAEVIRRQYSWDTIASRRLADYEAAQCPARSVHPRGKAA